MLAGARVPMAVVANLDRREEILDAALRVELDEMQRAPPHAFYAPRSREWFEGEVPSPHDLGSVPAGD